MSEEEDLQRAPEVEAETKAGLADPRAAEPPLPSSNEQGEREEGGTEEGEREEGDMEEGREEGGREEEEIDESSKELCREMFEKVTEYLNGELAVTTEEYQLLQKLNQMTIAKYTDMSALASRLNEVSQRLNDKYVSLQPYCDLIDQVESSVSSLEQTAYRLDAYCKRLETKFRELERR